MTDTCVIIDLKGVNKSDVIAIEIDRLVKFPVQLLRYTGFTDAGRPVDYDDHLIMESGLHQKV
jgi:hypothetical protein